MVGPSAVSSVPQQVPAQQPLVVSPADASAATSATSLAPPKAPASRLLVPDATSQADAGTGASARSFVGPGVATPVPPPAAPPAEQTSQPSAPSPEEAPAEARKEVLKYLEGALNKVSPHDLGIYQGWAKKKADENLKAQDAELQKQSSAANPDLSDLKKNLKDAGRLIVLTKPDPSRQEILQGIAEIKTMQAEAELRKLAKGTRELSVAERELSDAESQFAGAVTQIAKEMRPPAGSSPANTKGSATPEQQKKRIQDIASSAKRVAEDAMAKARNAAADVRVQKTQTRTATDAAADGWKHAEASAAKGPEAVACAKGYSNALRLGERVNVEMARQNERLTRLENDMKKLEDNLRKLQDILAKFASSLAPAAAREAQLAFHNMQLLLLEEAERIRRELGREADAEAVESDRRKVGDAQRQESKRVEADIRDMQQKQHHLAELKTAAANEKSEQDRERRRAEVAKREGPTSSRDRISTPDRARQSGEYKGAKSP
jgi:hypothetical protein